VDVQFITWLLAIAAAGYFWMTQRGAEEVRRRRVIKSDGHAGL
jgi:hypothetical protein